MDVIRKEVQLPQQVLGIPTTLTLVSDLSLGNLLIYLFSIWQLLEGFDRSGTLQRNIGFLLRLLWKDATGQSEFYAAAGLAQVQGRTLAVTRRRDEILCQRSGLSVGRIN